MTIMLLPRLVFAVALLFPPAHCQELEAVLCAAEFPVGTADTSAIIAGDGNIYLFGGWTPTVYLYNISADSLSPVGELPVRAPRPPFTTDAQGNIIVFGGVNTEADVIT